MYSSSFIDNTLSPKWSSIVSLLLTLWNIGQLDGRELQSRSSSVGKLKCGRKERICPRRVHRNTALHLDKARWDRSLYYHIPLHIFFIRSQSTWTTSAGLRRRTMWLPNANSCSLRQSPIELLAINKISQCLPQSWVPALSTSFSVVSQWLQLGYVEDSRTTATCPSSRTSLRFTGHDPRGS
jgi:hypothetical protein